MFSKIFKISVLGATMATLAACGGGGGGSAPTYTSQTVNGVAVDFYLKDATVSFSNSKCAHLKTDAQGNFSFKTTEACQNSDMTITGGTDIGTGLAFTGSLKLKTTDFNSANKIAVTPLTTLEKHLIDAGQQDQLATILKNLGLDTDPAHLSSFNPVADGNAQTAATAFALQQLINKIEDNLETLTVNGTTAFSAEQAAKIAFAAVIEVLKTQTLFTQGTLNFDTDALNTILNTAFTQAETQLQEKDPTLLIPNDIINTIATDTTLLGRLLNQLVSSGSSGQDLLTQISNPDVQQELKELLAPPSPTILQPHYADFNFAGYSLTNVINSSAVAPILINKTDIDKSFSIDFGIKNANTALTDTFKLGFSVNAKNSQNNEDLNVILDEIVVNFDDKGSVKSAHIAQGTLVTVQSSLAFPVPGTDSKVTYIKTEAPRDYSLTNNGGSISLAQLLNSDSRLQAAYNTYKDQLNIGSSLSSQIYIQPSKYEIDSALGFQTKTLNIKTDSFTAPSITAHFKLQ